EPGIGARATSGTPAAGGLPPVLRRSRLRVDRSCARHQLRDGGRNVAQRPRDVASGAQGRGGSHMNDDLALRDALDTLVPTTHETAEGDDVLERADALRETAGLTKRVRSLFPRRGRGLLLFAATGVATALILLAATAPWRGGPSVVERAAAAIASPV